MTIEEIVHGESNNIEFKVKLPEDSVKYIKTIIAFANTQGARISWDELTCIGYEPTDEEIEKLCADIMKYREEAGMSKRKVTVSQLINWKLLKKTEASLFASNAFALLASDYFPFSKTQCAVFKGTERNVFLDKREFAGPVYEQIESAAAFVLRNIRLGASIEGLVRKEAYELPIEAWGTGIRRIKEAAEKYGLPIPEIQVFDDMFRVNLYRNQTLEAPGDHREASGKHRGNIGEASEKHRRKIGERSEKN